MTNIKQARDDVIRKNSDRSTSDEALPQHFVAVWCMLNRNLAHYLLARDPHVRLLWTRDDEDLVCDLSDDVQLRLPATASAEQQSAPSGRDMTLLFVLLRLMRLTGRPDLHVTQTELLKATEVARGGDGRRWLQAALQCWSQRRIVLQRWRVGDKHRVQELPPPIKQLKADRRGLHIVMDPTWSWKRNDGYCTPIPCDLPHDAVAHNLLVNLFTQPPDTPNGRLRIGKRELDKLCRKLGLTRHGTYRRTLKRSIALVDQYCKRYDGFAKISVDGPWLRYRVALPEIAKQKPKQPKAKLFAKPPKPSKSEQPTKRRKPKLSRAEWIERKRHEREIEEFKLYNRPPPPIEQVVHYEPEPD